MNLENQNLKKIINQNNNEEKFNKILKEIELYKNKILQLEQEKITFLNELENCKKFYEKNISELKDENQVLKNMLEEKNKEMEKMVNKFDIERNEFIETMKSLREIIIQKEKEKNIILNNKNTLLNNISRNTRF